MGQHPTIVAVTMAGQVLECMELLLNAGKDLLPKRKCWPEGQLIGRRWKALDSRRAELSGTCTFIG